jgi:hypothetical protein
MKEAVKRVLAQSETSLGVWEHSGFTLIEAFLESKGRTIRLDLKLVDYNGEVVNNWVESDLFGEGIWHKIYVNDSKSRIRLKTSWTNEINFVKADNKWEIVDECVEILGYVVTVTLTEKNKKMDTLIIHNGEVLYHFQGNTGSKSGEMSESLKPHILVDSDGYINIKDKIETAWVPAGRITRYGYDPDGQRKIERHSILMEFNEECAEMIKVK